MAMQGSQRLTSIVGRHWQIFLQANICNCETKSPFWLAPLPQALKVSNICILQLLEHFLELLDLNLFMVANHSLALLAKYHYFYALRSHCVLCGIRYMGITTSTGYAAYPVLGVIPIVPPDSWERQESWEVSAMWVWYLFPLHLIQHCYRWRFHHVT